MTLDIGQFLKERDEALRKLDLDYARKQIPQGDDFTLLVSLHKARYEVRSMPQELREESRAWLEERGFSRFGMKAFPPRARA